MIICGTGHRPPRLGGYSKDVLRALIAVADEALSHANPDLVISGVALGWDTALAIAAIRRGIPCKAYAPFEGQDARWPAEDRQRYRKILSKCESVVYASVHGYTPTCMNRRNELMVDDSDLVLAMWDGEEKGGTWHCIDYAKKRGKEITNLFENYSGVGFEV